VNVDAAANAESEAALGRDRGALEGRDVKPPTADSAPTAATKAAVRQAALDYVEGIYTVDTSRNERSVHSNLTRRGIWREPVDASYRPETVMTFDQLMKWQIINIVWQAHPPKAPSTASRE
jgi:hypothetical protein